ncbi:MAG: cupin domain-containing protein [Chloroflexi bacterium]|nr:cupin domain-containing protein [Chloroflexota bacterium]
MKVIRSDEVEEQDATEAPIFFGGRVSRRLLVNKDLSKQFAFNIVSFEPGARNKLHTHTSDQILFVTDGAGHVATEGETFTVSEGDTVFIPAGEKHWHGATEDSEFAHVALLSPTSQTEIFD